MFAHVAQGAFYWFPNIQGVLDACAKSSGGVASAATGEPIETDADLAKHLLAKANVVALPGSEVSSSSAGALSQPALSGVWCARTPARARALCCLSAA
jgi:aspartate/methionine/tyrosine aminotransferase